MTQTMTSTTNLLLVVTIWSSALATLSMGFQEPIVHRRAGVSIPTTSSSALFEVPEPLAEEDTWQAYLDEETTGLIYYFDTATGESRWEPPTSTFPTVRLPRRKQRLAENLRREYRKGRLEMMELEEDESDNSEGGVAGLFSAMTSVLEQDEVMVEETVEEEILEEELEIEDQVEEDKTKGGGWFGNFFNDDEVDEQTISEESVVEEAVEEEETKDTGKGLFGAMFGAGSASIPVEDEEAVEEEPVSKDESKGGMFASPFFSGGTARTEKQIQENIIDNTPKTIKIDIGSHILPHPAKVRWGGEDATFVKGRTFGVFDGVSGAEKLDGVPLYSRTLANEMKKMCGTGGETVQDITAYLSSAASYADGAATGASTAVVASIGENGFLQALNVGDSCCMIVRDGKVTAKTREISHYWECPYQLSEDSPDQPKDGTKLNVELISGDVIIMGSDGVFDNVNDNQLLDIVTQNRGVKPTSLAKKICDVSRKVSLDKTAVTPYSKQAQRRGDADYRDGLGGKVDDVSCIVVVCK